MRMAEAHEATLLLGRMMYGGGSGGGDATSSPDITSQSVEELLQRLDEERLRQEQLQHALSASLNEEEDEEEDEISPQ